MSHLLPLWICANLATITLAASIAPVSPRLKGRQSGSAVDTEGGASGGSGGGSYVSQGGVIAIVVIVVIVVVLGSKMKTCACHSCYDRAKRKQLPRQCSMSLQSADNGMFEHLSSEPRNGLQDAAEPDQPPQIDSRNEWACRWTACPLAKGSRSADRLWLFRRLRKGTTALRIRPSHSRRSRRDLGCGETIGRNDQRPMSHDLLRDLCIIIPLGISRARCTIVRDQSLAASYIIDSSSASSSSSSLRSMTWVGPGAVEEGGRVDAPVARGSVFGFTGG